MPPASTIAPRHRTPEAAAPALAPANRRLTVAERDRRFGLVKSAQALPGVPKLTPLQWEALDMLEGVKDRIFVGPAFGLVHNSVYEGERVGMTREVVERMGLYRKFDHTCATYHEIRKRGIRVVVGGDYGFSITPMGQNARDIAHFRVEHALYQSVDVLVSDVARKRRRQLCVHRQQTTIELLRFRARQHIRAQQRLYPRAAAIDVFPPEPLVHRQAVVQLLQRGRGAACETAAPELGRTGAWALGRRGVRTRVSLRIRH